MKNLQL